MTTRNDVTGDEIKSKSNSNKYRSNWDNVFQTKSTNDRNRKKEGKTNGT